MIRILGIDPGSLITGYGIIEVNGSLKTYISSGSVHVHGPFADRVKTLFVELREIVEAYRPDEVALEQVFMHRNADSALKLGQARGAAICASAQHALPVGEYSARAIKQAVVGKGNAAKTQVQHMVKILLNLPGLPAADAADALAVALCHSHTRETYQRTPLLMARRRR